MTSPAPIQGWLVTEHGQHTHLVDQDGARVESIAPWFLAMDRAFRDLRRAWIHADRMRKRNRP